MSDEPRRSGRATKGQHKNASSSPAPMPKPAKTAKSKPPKKSLDAEPGPEDEDDDNEVIRCICGNTNSKDKRAFIGCDACTVWQHNICMGMPEAEDEVPEHYFCEECRPEEHQEAIQAMAQGEKIWESRNRIYQNEKKMSKSRKSKSDFRPGWLKQDSLSEDTAPAKAGTPTPVPSAAPSTNGGQDPSNKRKRDEDFIKEEEQQPATQEKAMRSGRQDKRRKSSTIDTKSLDDPNTALVSIDQLPKDRQNVAQAIEKVISSDIDKRVKSGMKVPGGQTAGSLAEHHATRIEYALQMNHGVGQPGYRQQFMALNANLKKNTVLIERLLDGSLSADELSTMSSGDMASEELQRERVAMKEALDRQAIAIEAEGPKYKQDHKGFHLIEDAGQQGRTESAPDPPPDGRNVLQESAPAPGKGSPVWETPLTIDTKQADGGHERRSSSQQFDMTNIWAKTAQSPTMSGPPGVRPVQSPRRQSSIQVQQNGTKDDADVDRLLDDDDETYSPAAATGEDAIVWRGRLVQTSGEEAPVINARFVAGRDLAPSVKWGTLLPEKLSIDGRLSIPKAEEYLCGLRWSSSSDVSVLALTPLDNREAFDSIFNYFKSRQRYAVVEKDKPTMVKDLYIIPVDPADNKLPDHVGLLEHCTIKLPIEEKLLLATFVVARAPDSAAVMQESTPSHQSAAPNGHLPQHVRQSVSGPAGSPLSAQNPTFSPANSAPPQSPYGPPPGPHAFPPNPYGPPQPPPSIQQPAGYPPQAHHTGAYPPQAGVIPPVNPQVTEILGELQNAPTAQLILREAPNLTRDQLVNLRAILTEDENARTDFQALTNKLFGGSS